MQNSGVDQRRCPRKEEIVEIVCVLLIAQKDFIVVILFYKDIKNRIVGNYKLVNIVTVITKI